MTPTSILIVLIAPGAVAAEDAAPWWLSAVAYAASAAGAWLLALLGRLLNQGFAYLAERTRLQFLGNVDEALMAIVTDIYNVEVEAVKDAAADGKLTAAERARFKWLAVERLKAHFTFAQLSKIFTGDADVIEAKIGERVELAVTAAKTIGRIGKKKPVA